MIYLFFHMNRHIDIHQLSCLCIGFNWGNTFIAHPLIKLLLAGNNKLLHSSGKIIDNYIFIKDLFFYDKRDIVVKEEFENIIFVHGRLSKLYQIGYYINFIDK